MRGKHSKMNKKEVMIAKLLKNSCRLQAQTLCKEEEVVLLVDGCSCQAEGFFERIVDDLFPNCLIFLVFTSNALCAILKSLEYHEQKKQKNDG